MTSPWPARAEQIVVGCPQSHLRMENCVACRECIATALATTAQEGRARYRIEIIADAKDRGYLDHRDDCRKGVDSETCTCGIMTWLVTEPPHA